MHDSFEYISDAVAHSFEGVTVLRVTLRRPRLGISAIDDFFAELARSIKAFAKEELFPALCEEYKADPDPRRRFTFGYIYRLDCKVTNRTGEYTDISTYLTLRRKSSTANIFCEDIHQTFRLADGCLMPPKLKLYIDKQAKKLKENSKNSQ